MRQLWIMLAVAGAACSSTDDDPPPPQSCFLGDEASPAEIRPIYLTADGTMMPLEENGQVPLILPPQGGKVMFVGVRARNLDGCPITITTSLRDPCGDSVIALERRPVLLEDDGEGWLRPVPPLGSSIGEIGVSNYSNLPACPRANIDRDVHGQPYLLTIRVEDKAGRTAEESMQIVPFCSQPEFMEGCLCECRADYKLGVDCSAERPDAGPGGCSADAG